MDTEQGYIFVPVTSLMCEDVPHNEVFIKMGAMGYDELQTFFALLPIMLGRWYDAIAHLAPSIRERYDEAEQLIGDLHVAFVEVLEDDGPDAFDKRAVLRDEMERFSYMIENLAGAFTGPSELREFYFNINSRLMATSEAIMRGTHGW